ncbi:MAG: hypothetical protein JSU01_08290 [Bacteroidetes bacterium]|nr:hypothetical protein [Bacteroidota bacterium]
MARALSGLDANFASATLFNRFISAVSGTALALANEMEKRRQRVNIKALQFEIKNILIPGHTIIILFYEKQSKRLYPA